MIWLYDLALAVVSFYIGAVMGSGRWNPWRSAGKRRRSRVGVGADD